MYINFQRSQPFPETARLDKVIDLLKSGIFELGNEFIEFKHVLEPFPNPILITTTDAKVLYVNPAWEKLTGYKLSEVEGKNPKFLRTRKTPPAVFKKLWSSLAKGKTFTTEEMIDRRKDGTEYQINSTVFAVKNASRILFYIQIQQDITSRKKLEDLKREFLSTATHELKTPITTLKLLVQSQLRKVEKNPKENINISELKLVDRELNRLLYIINDLSDVSRIDTGKFHMNMQSINIDILINDVIVQMKTISDNHEIVYKKPGNITVIADENRIKQVLINLVKNAIRYSYPKSKVVVSVSQRNKNCIVAVQNEGEGIPRQNFDTIFDRFYQMHEYKNSGLGLGLYVSKQIIEQHKGKIWVTSEPKKLTTFYFSLKMM
jgi:PAS domain S-box-containing protein